MKTTIELFVLVALLSVTLWLVIGSILQVREDVQKTKRDIWEGYYHACLNHRYALRLAPGNEHAAEMAIEWRKLQSKWGELRNSSRLHNDARTRIRKLWAEQDAIEEREDPSLYDPDLMLEVQDELDECLGMKQADLTK